MDMDERLQWDKRGRKTNEWTQIKDRNCPDLHNIPTSGTEMDQGAPTGSTTSTADYDLKKTEQPLRAVTED
ncbi:hypothetical protein INR49_008815 [Caranx melampygus]|nr:hypothetical protein INR49_008815 [Caranx melampygus]